MPKNDKEKLKKLVRGIVLAQGNVFVKELLRKHHITIGATKAEFEKNLIAAIDEDKLTEEQFEEWLGEVEGWGDQHVYLYAVSRATAEDPAWRDPAKVLARAKKARLGKYWEAKSSDAFPEERTLTGIYLDDGCFRLVWHEGFPQWIYEEDKNLPPRWEGLDYYEYRAYRQRLKRSVMRFEYETGSGAAALFMQIPWSKADHAAAKDQVRMILRHFLDVEALEEMSLGRAIKALDRGTLTEKDREKSGVASQASWFLSRKKDAYVRFGSTAAGVDYTRVDSVRKVREALPKSVRGDEGIFYFLRKKVRAKWSRGIKVQIYAPQKRIRIWHQCSRSDVYKIVGRILRSL